MSRSCAPALLVLLLLLGLGGSTVEGQCVREWSDAFPGGDFDGPINVVREWNGDLYVGGDFTRAGGQPASGIARWDGTGWEEVGGGVLPRYSFLFVQDLAIFDDGGGEDLYVAGNFLEAGGLPIRGLARWDGTSWSSLGDTGFVQALAVHDDGTGPALYAGGFFEEFGGVPALDVARWDGSTWSAVGTGLQAAGWGVNALTEWNDGTSTVLVAGGDFTEAGGVPARRLAAWNGGSWSEIAGGVGDTVYELDTWSPGASEVLLVGGQFTEVNGVPAGRIAGWDGSTWETFAGGVGPDYLGAQAFATFDAGDGEQLYVGGRFSDAGGTPVANLARWNGTSWSPAPVDVNSRVHVLEVVGSELIIGGHHTRVDGQVMMKIAAWDGTTAHGFDNDDLGNGLSSVAYDFTVVDFDGPGGADPRTFAVGGFVNAGPVTVDGVAELDGDTWLAVGGGVSGGIQGGTLEVATAHSSAGGQVLAVAGSFTDVGGSAGGHVAIWDGTAWDPLGGGLASSGFPPIPNALASFDPGGGARLYVAGDRFDSAGGVAVNRIAAWDGANWSDVGGGFPSGYVSDLAVHDDGTGTRLYAVGSFALAGGTAVSNVARWNGSTWEDVGGGTNGSVGQVASVDGGPLYVTGSFTMAGGVAANGVARWTGSQWQDASTGFEGSFPLLTTFDDGTGAAPWASFPETLPDGRLRGRLARWTGAAWITTGDYFGGFIRGLGIGRDPVSGAECLLVGGDFLTGPDGATARIARWQCSAAVAAVSLPGGPAPGRIRFVSPNPTPELAEVHLALDRAADVRLTVHDVRGALVRRLAERRFDAGEHVVEWGTRDFAEQPVAAGVYFVRLEVAGEVESARVVITR